MKCLPMVLVVGLVVAASTPDKGDAIRRERKKLEGTWTVVKLAGGVDRRPRITQEVPPADVEPGKIRCTIKGERLSVMLEGELAGSAAVRIDPTRKPQGFDIQPDGEKDAALGIYELNGETLRISFAPPGKDRPSKFLSKAVPGTGNSLVIMRREKH